MVTVRTISICDDLYGAANTAGEHSIWASIDLMTIPGRDFGVLTLTRRQTKLLSLVNDR